MIEAKPERTLSLSHTRAGDSQMPRFFAEVIGALLAEHGLDTPTRGLEDLDREQLAVPASGYAAMLERASIEQGNPTLGLELAEHVIASNLDVFGALIVASRTIREALADVGAIQLALLGRVLWTIPEQGDRAFATPSYTTNAVMTDFTLAIAYRCAQHALTPADRGAVRAYLTNVPSDVAPYRAVFGDNIEFRSPRIGLSIPRADATRARDRAHRGS